MNHTLNNEIVHKFSLKPRGLEFDKDAKPDDWLIAGMTAVSNYENAPLAICDAVRYLTDQWKAWCLEDDPRQQLEIIFGGEVDPDIKPNLAAIADLIHLPVNTLYNWRSVIEKFPVWMRDEFDPLYITHGYYQAVTDYRGVSLDEMLSILRAAQAGLRDNEGFYFPENEDDEKEKVTTESVRRRCIAIQKELKERGDLPDKGEPRLSANLSVYPSKTINVFLTREDCSDPMKVFEAIQQSLSFLEDEKAQNATGVTLSVKAYIAIDKGD